jgi:opacity protein-like surface antigen
MKKITNIIKTTIAVSICLFVSATGFTQKTTEGFGGWSVSFRAGYATGNSNLHWNSAIQVAQVSNLLVPGGALVVVPGRNFSMPDTCMHTGGAAASLHIGYKKVFSHLFIGAELGFGKSSFKGSQTSTFYPETMLQARNPLTIQRDVSAGLSKMLDMQIGYTKGPHLVYAMAGIAITPVKVTSTDDYQLSFRNVRAYGTAAAGSYDFTSVTHNQQQVQNCMGVSWGVGYQYLVTGDVSLGLEFRQAGFGSKSYTTEKVTGVQPTDSNGAKTGVAAGIGESTITADLKQQAFTLKVEVALSAIFKKK